jgi:GNAT superfamily N-acetyltransferase
MTGAVTGPVTPAGPGDIEPLAELIATAFAGLAVAQWLIPEPDDRVPVLAAQFTIVLAHALDHGAIDTTTTTDRSAVAVWFHHDQPIPDIADYDQRLARACGRHTGRFRQFDAALAARHPDMPHHYLALLAAHPDQQARGQGSALLRHHHTQLDRAGLPAYAEASNPGVRRLNQRHGYTDHGPVIALPDSNAHLWPMWRPPQTPRPITRPDPPSRTPSPRHAEL